jgi:hypothetical protein
MSAGRDALCAPAKRRAPVGRGASSAVERWWPATALGVLLVLGAALALWQTRGTTLSYDEWSWTAERWDLSLSTLLEPHNQHLSLIPVAIYRCLFATVGLDDYTPYRLVLAAGHVSCGAAVFLYVRARVGAVLAVAATVLVIFNGAAWQNILWPFQIAWLVSVAAGIAALLALDRGERVADAVAAALLTVSVASSGVGLTFMVVAGVDIAVSRRRWRDALIVAVPLALYGAWWIGFQEPGPPRMPIADVPLYLLRSASAALLSLVGLYRPPGISIPSVSLTAGVPLLLALLAVTAWRLRRLGHVPPRVIALAVGAISFWALAAIQRGSVSPPGTSRYIYVGAVLIILLAADLARGASIRSAVAAGLCFAAIAVGVSFLPVFGDVAGQLRHDAERTRVALGAADLARDNVAATENLEMLPGYPIVVLQAAQYFRARDAWGSPAASASQIAAAAPGIRSRADAELARFDDAALRPPPGPAREGAPPPLNDAVGGRAERRQSCLTFATSTAREGALAVTVPPQGLLLRARGAPATLELRRFAASFSAKPLGRIRAGTAARLAIRADRARQPWHARVRTRGSVTICPA